MGLETVRPSGFAKLAIELALLFLPAAAATEPKGTEDPEALLQRIRSRMAENLSQLPNYTCHEVIDRLIRRASSGSFEHRDQVELEVAFIGKREFFAKAGEGRFQEQPIHEIVRGGTISSGAFGSGAAAIFSREGAEFKYAGPSKKNGHRAFRFDFFMAQEKSGFQVSHDSSSAIVAYKGSFWADAETLDLVRLELKADRLPSYLGVRQVEESVKYKLVRIRNAEFLLPQSSEVAASDVAGNYSLNIINFERCREFTGESIITYDSPADSTSAAHQSPER